MKKNLVTSITLAMGLCAATLLSSCSPVTPQTRIQKNPSIYNKLSESQQAMVRQGQIKKGMHKDGVFLAWGKPSAVSQGYKNNRSFEKWVYKSPEPVYSYGFSPFIGYGVGRYGRGYGRAIYGAGINPRVNYIRRTRATVDFNSYGKVDSWEARK